MILQAIGYSPKGYRKPTRWAYWAFAALAAARDYFVSEGVGTFQVAQPWSVTGSLTWEQLAVRRHPLVWNGFNLCKDAMSEVRQRYNICEQRKGYYLFYFHPPLANPETFVWQGAERSITTNGNPEGMGGMTGNENWGCDFSRPGTAIMGDIMAWLACGYSFARLIQMGWPVETNWTKDWVMPVRAIVHEIGHMADLPHPESDDGSPMSMWMWDNRHFTGEQKEVLRGFFR